ncbi:MAG: cell wall-binding repeat-containing protein [Ruminiclostridium sp.]|nr:cell wall-binding repeat-containing protein [Ruminiclostridium sp.]
MNSVGVINTLNTTRICGGDIFQNAVEISDIVYADKSPGSIILANAQLYQDAFAATSLIHFPRNAPILYSQMNYISPDTINQIFKLRPGGVDGTQVFLVGGVSYFTEQQLNMLGLKTKRIAGPNFLETSAKVAEYLNYPENIMIVSGEDYREGLPACAWAAHMGDPVLFTAKDYLPVQTVNAILKTKNPNIFIIGSPNTVSSKIENELGKLNAKFVGRISGSTPYEIAVNFAKYKSPDGKFGWNRTERNGHAFTFVSISSPFDNASGSLFAHLGKHTPILVVANDRLPEATRSYIESVKPVPAPEPRPPFMHGWVVGCENAISTRTQLEIENTLSIDEAHAHVQM